MVARCPLLGRIFYNSDMADSDWSGRTLMIHYYDDGNWAEPELAILINMTREPVTFSLPTSVTWERLIDTQAYFDTAGLRNEPTGYFNDNDDDLFLSANINLETPIVVDEGSYAVQGSSIVILREKSTMMLSTLLLSTALAGQADVGGYFRIMTRPDLQGGSGRLGYWNLYGRLLNEGPYATMIFATNLQKKP